MNVTLGYVAGPTSRIEYTIRTIGTWDDVLRTHPKDLSKVYTAADILRRANEGRIGVIYGFQNAAMMGNDASRVDTFADLGVRVIQLTYNPAQPAGRRLDGAGQSRPHAVRPRGGGAAECEARDGRSLAQRRRTPASTPRARACSRSRSITPVAARWSICRATRPTRNCGWWRRKAASSASISCRS